jgi:quinol monooxygenase YgiN
MRNPLSTVLVFTAAVALSSPVWAQRPVIRRVTMATIKPGRVTEFVAAVKEYNSAYAKVPGVRARGMFQSLSGPQQFVLVRDAEKWSDLDPGTVSKAISGNAELARLNMRMVNCIESQMNLVEVLLPALSTPTRPDAPPKMIRLARSRVQPSKTKEFEALVQNELLPAYMKAGAKSFTVRRVRFGGPTNDYYISTRLEDWADLENTLQKSMGDAAYNALVTKLTALTISREINIYRFRDDLSFSPNQGATPSASSTR